MRKASRPRKVRTASVAAPVGGLNARDSIANMKATDAIVMDNWVPGTTSVTIRKGYTSQQSGYSATVESLLVYNAATTSKMFAASGTVIYDATAIGTRGAAVVTGLSNARLQFANFGTIGGQYLYAVNGADKALLYDGTTWIRVLDGVGAVITTITHVGTTATVTTATPHGLTTGRTITVTGAAPADYNVTAKPITVTGANTFTYVMATNPATNATVVGTFTFGQSIQGVDTSLFKDVNIYGRRLWFTEKNSFRVWYLPVDSIAGTASSIDLGSLFILGGSLQGMVVWTVASDLSTTSYAAFVSSEGEVLLYSGINPDSADAFNLVGTFRIGKPVGQRFWARVGSDTVLITQDGLMPLSKAMFMNRGSQSDAISYKIINLINADLEIWGSQFGWQIILYPTGDKLICNVPKGAAADNIQYVMNTLTNQWCRYVNIPSFCWALFNDAIYFGGTDGVYRAEYGNNDNLAGITASLVPAYSYYGASGANKIFTAIRPIIRANGDYKPQLGLLVDFQDTLQVSLSTPSLSLGNPPTLWDTSPWDVSRWGDIIRTTRNWQYIGNIGFAAAPIINSITKNMDVEMMSYDITFEVSTGVF